MKLKALIDLPNTSLDSEQSLDRMAYAGLIRHLSLFNFWPTNGARTPKLWSSQEAAICLAAAYLGADRTLPLEKFANEAALVKMPTGTGKSAIISVLCRCLPDIRRVLVLTPREALTDQLYRYVRYRFWSTMEIDTTSSAGTFHDDGARAGGPVPDAYVTKLLPSSVRQILNARDTQTRIVLVGTLQALDQIRRTASKKLTGDASVDQNVLLFNEFLRLIAKFDLVVVDEGHYEPAISWSRAIRDADLPTILFSATPYRNDYKSFRVRGRFVFSQSIQEALADRIIRKPIFSVLDDVPSTIEPARIDAEVRTVLSESEDTEREGDLSDREKADAPRFARALAEATKSIPTPPGVKNPKIIVRADERAKLELLRERHAGTTR